MAFPQVDTLNLIPAVLNLQLTITKGGGWTLGLDVTDAAGAPLTLTGTTATIILDNTTTWTATISGSRYVWDIPKSSVDALSKYSGDARLVVSDGTHTTVWAQGKYAVI